MIMWDRDGSTYWLRLGRLLEDGGGVAAFYRGRRRGGRPLCQFARNPFLLEDASSLVLLSVAPGMAARPSC